MIYTFSYVKNGVMKNLQVEAVETNFEINYTELSQWGAVNNRTYNLFGTIGGGQTGTQYYYQYITQLGDPYTRFSALPNRIYTGLIEFVDWTDTRYQLVMSDQMDFISGDTLLNNSYKKLHCGKGHVRLNFAMKTVYEQGQPVTKFVNSGFANFNPNDYESDQGLIAVSGSTAAYTYDSRYRSPNLYFMRCTLNVNTTGTPYDGKKLPIVAILRSRYDAGADYPSYSEIIFIDERLIDGGTPPTPSGSDTKKNSTPTGWKGSRNTASSSDNPTVCPDAIKYSVNFGEFGIHLYECTNDNINDLSGIIFNEYVHHLFDNWDPKSGILSLHKLPYEPDTMVNEKGERSGLVHIAGREAYAQGTKYKPLSYIGDVEDYVYECYGTYIVGGQNKTSVTKQIFPFFGSFLDFEPYTKIQVRLPFIGTVSVPTSACMGGEIMVNYILDNRNGNCVAQILCKSMRNLENENSNGFIIVGQYSGNCALPAALCGNTTGGEARIGAVRGFASSAVATGAAAALGVVSGPVAAAGVIGSAVNAGVNYATAPTTPDIIGSINCEAACMEDLTVRVLITRPVDVTPGDFHVVDGERVFEASSLLDQKGFASYSGGTVSQYEGMTIGYIRGAIEGTTEAEMIEIKNAFLGGVIV